MWQLRPQINTNHQISFNNNQSRSNEAQQTDLNHPENTETQIQYV